jgi:hypothetical protein
MSCQHPLDVKDAKELNLNKPPFVPQHLMTPKKWRPNPRRKRSKEKHRALCYQPE